MNLTTSQKPERVFKVLHLFSGLGGGGLGFSLARQEWNGVVGRFETLAGIDVDPEANEDFEAIVGAPATRMDLFSRADYTAFHGKEPPQGWREVMPADVRAVTKGVRPDVVFLSSPCKGLSGLLPKARAESEKYQALNRLTIRGIALVVEAWREDPPGLIIFENVPRITTRGKHLLTQIKALLAAYGYRFHEDTHDMGELGGLSQRRRRYLLVARRPTRIPAFLYQPPLRKVRSIGQAIGPLPLPGDPRGGPMHRLPRLSWLTWVRLALIPAGGDWRALQDIAPGSYSIRPERTPFNHIYRVTGFDQPFGAVTSSRDQGVADPRIPEEAAQFGQTYHVVKWQDPAGTMKAAHGPTNGAGYVADPRISHEPRKGVFGVNAWDEPSKTVIGSASVRGSNGVAAVQDPRVRPHGTNYKGSPGLMGVIPWEAPAPAVTGSTSVTGSNMPAAVQDPRPADRCSGRRSGRLSVRPWDEAANTVTGEDSVGSGAQSIADPRLTCAPHNGAMRVVAWDETAPTVTASGDVHAQGAAAVADPRLPEDNQPGAWVIIAEDGTWHRPLTTYELAVLQGLPTHMRDGRPLNLAGKSHARMRERIGNAVPVPSAQAVAEQMLLTLLATAERQWLWALYGTVIWVRQETVRRRVAAFHNARRKAAVAGA